MGRACFRLYSREPRSGARVQTRRVAYAGAMPASDAPAGPLEGTGRSNVASYSKGRVEYHSKTFHKGRRPRRRIKSTQARKGVWHLKLILALIAGFAIVGGVWLHREALNERGGQAALPATSGR